jgi:hypothetical protein
MRCVILKYSSRLPRSIVILRIATLWPDSEVEKLFKNFGGVSGRLFLAISAATLGPGQRLRAAGRVW